MAREYKHRSEITVDWDRMNHIKGTVIEVKTLPVKRDGKEESARYLLVDGSKALYRVFDTATLKDLIDAASPGDKVDITFLEKVKLDGGKTMRTFDAQLYTGEDDEPEVTPPTA